MNSQFYEMLLSSLILLAFPVIVALLWAKGCLSARALAEAPVRRTGLQPVDLVIGIVLGMLAGQLAVRIPWLAPYLDAAAEAPRQKALGALTTQTVTQLPVVIYILVAAGRAPGGIRQLGVTPRRFGREITLGCLALLAAVPLVQGLIVASAVVSKFLGYPVPVLAHNMLPAMRQAESWVTLALMLGSALVLAPILEEIIFRGLVQTALLAVLGPSARWTVLIAASVLFAAMHVGSVAWQVLPALFALGLILGWVYERSGSLLPNVIVHMGFNSLMIAVTLLLPPDFAHQTTSNGWINQLLAWT